MSKKIKDEHHVRKYNRVATRGKCNFPTIMDYKQPAQVGSMKAQQDIERELGHSISHWKPAHTRHLWRWKKLIGEPAKK